MCGAGESYSDVILRLAKVKRLQTIPSFVAVERQCGNYATVDHKA
jgi:hypothetical protein